MRVPDLQGTWEGELQSTWINPETKQGIPPLKMVLVIRQSFSSVSCTMFTKESESYSRAAQIAVEEGDGCDQLELQLHESLQGHHPEQESYP